MRNQIRRGFQAPQLRQGQGGSAREGQDSSGLAILGQSQIRQNAKMEFSRAKRYGYALTLVVCRIDRIDSLSDLYGQESRRLLMDRLSDLFAHRARTTDVVGRLSEDRLLWVMPHTDLEGGQVAADRMRMGIESMEIQSGSKLIPVTLSLGLSCFTEGNTLFFDSILYQAEKALERAQAMGGNLCEEHPLPTTERARRPYLPDEEASFEAPPVPIPEAGFPEAGIPEDRAPEEEERE